MREQADRATVRQIAEALDVSRQAVHRRTKQQSWQPTGEKVRGGGDLYDIENLPLPAEQKKRIRDYLLDRQIAALPEPVCTLPAVQPENLPAPAEADKFPLPAQLAGWQRRGRDGRHAILNLIDRLAEGASLNKAIDKVVAQAKNGALPPHIQGLVPVANARSAQGEGKQTLSRRTLYRWRDLREIERASGRAALAPQAPAKKPVPPWAKLFLKCYRKPQKVSVPEALEELELILPEGIEMPSEAQCYRLLEKMSKVDRERGRRTGNDLRALRPFRRRDTSDLMPLEVTLCDGHSFKAKVAHPGHGRPFHPEVCAVIDAATRMALGWSAGLAESAQTVADALRHACTVTPDKPAGGIPMIFYTDPGSGNKAKVNADPAFGRYARLGIDFKTGIVGNSQARGLIERFQKTVWIRAAKQLPTFTGKDMDGSVLHKTTRLLDKDIKNQGRSDLLISWPQFLDLCQQAIDRYNHRPHSELPKITDPQTGRRRHMTPAEMWATFAARGWQPDTLSPAEIEDLFRPCVQVGTRRGEVRLFNNIYFHSELQHHHGEQVLVEYEVQDGRFVWVRDLEERLICKAKFEGNKSRFYPVSASEAAMEQRADRRRKLKERQIEEIELERSGTTVIEAHSDPALIESRERLAIELNTPAKPVHQVPQDARSRYRLACAYERDLTEGKALSTEATTWLQRYQRNHEYRTFRSVEEELGGSREQRTSTSSETAGEDRLSHRV